MSSHGHGSGAGSRQVNGGQQSKNVNVLPMHGSGVRLTRPRSQRIPSVSAQSSVATANARSTISRGRWYAALIWPTAPSACSRVRRARGVLDAGDVDAEQPEEPARVGTVRVVPRGRVGDGGPVHRLGERQLRRRLAAVAVHQPADPGVLRVGQSAPVVDQLVGGVGHRIERMALAEDQPTYVHLILLNAGSRRPCG